MLEFFKKLFGMATEAAEDITRDDSSQRSNEEELKKHIKGIEHIEGAENIRISSGKVLKEVKGAALIEDEDDGDRLWRDTWNREVKPEQWVDEWGPVAPKDFDDFWQPFLGGQGPAPSYVASLAPARRDALRNALRASLPPADDGSIALIARAFAVRGCFA